MMWTDYNIQQAGDAFAVIGDWPGEVMGKKQDGSEKGYALYRPGDVFAVNENGWLVKQPLQPGDVLMVNSDGQLIKVAADTLEEK